MKVRLSRILADYLDGIDVRNHRVGDVIDLPPSEAQLLIAEEWAIPERREADRPPPAGHDRRKPAGERGHEDERSQDTDAIENRRRSG
jgi:hypothetical protein